MWLACKRIALGLSVAASVAFPLCVSAQDQEEGTPGQLANRPLFLGGGVGVPGNLVLVPSIEWPTVESVANLDGRYTSDRAYEGYFDSAKCYRYQYSSDEEQRHFYPVSTTSDRRCTGSGQWSGNFLNWATTQTIDPFRKVLTGGYRVKDTPTETWLEKARHPGQGSGFPNRELNDWGTVQGATPFSDSYMRMRISGLGNQMRFRVGDSGVNENVQSYDPADFEKDEGAYSLSVRVEVCNESVGLEDNCVEYDQGWKPEGVIQENADRLRYSVLSFLNQDGPSRDGGVLRARQKFVGPERLEEGDGFVSNPNREWDPDTGELIQNPDPDDADATSPNIEHSGVISYINEAGQLNEGENNKSQDPVSELYYTATRYLKNQGSVDAYSDMSGAGAWQKEDWRDGFPVIEDWGDPIAYECQANVMLGIGDANTHDDKNLPGNNTYRADEPAMPPEVQNDDTVNVLTETNRVGAIEGIGDIANTNDFTGRDNSAYIAGLAYHNKTRDMRPNMPGIQTASTHWVDVLENQVLEPTPKNQYYLATKYGGFEVPDDASFDPETRTEPLPEDWWHANDETLDPSSGSDFPRPDNYYTAGSAANMVDSLEAAFEQVLEESEGASTGITFNTATLETDTLLFGARFDSNNWSGQLFAQALSEADGTPELEDSFEWEAGAVLDGRDLEASPRQIMTYDASAGASVPFTWDSLSDAQRNDFLAGGVNQDRAKERLAYLRGEAVDSMRDRDSRLGDIVNSTPVYVQDPAQGWPDSGEFGESGNRYSSFRLSNQDRRAAVYVGANDGMLHGFAAGSDEGDELFAYVPDFVYSDAATDGLHYLTQPDYEHRYYVDLSPVVSDVFVEGPNGGGADWRTVLIGGGGKGKRGLFALDVTDPDAISEGNAADLAMWEFTPEDDSRLGYITQPPVVGMAQWGKNDYRWTAFFGNGYNSGSDSSGIFMLDLEGGLDGSWSNDDYRYIEFESGGAHGLSPVRAVDLDGDSMIDRLYAGDLDGNIWVATPGNKGDWSSPYSQGKTTTPLFTTDSNQPITAAPMVVRNPKEGSDPNLMVLFGTGQYLTKEDPLNSATQSFYGVLEQGSDELTRANLEPRSLSEETIDVDGELFDVRYADGDDVEGSVKGWYVDFDTVNGERIIQSPQVRGDYVFVNSSVPTQNLCDAGGEGWLMAFGLDGRTPDDPVFTRFENAVVGYKTEGGLPEQSGFLGDYMLTPKSDGEIVTDEVDVGGDDEQFGRAGWQELIE